MEELWITDLQCKNKTLTQPDRVSKAEKRVTRYLFFFLSFVSFYCKNDSFSASFRVCMRKILVAGEKIGNKQDKKSTLFLKKSCTWTWVPVPFLVRRLLLTVQNHVLVHHWVRSRYAKFIGFVFEINIWLELWLGLRAHGVSCLI